MIYKVEMLRVGAVLPNGGVVKAYFVQKDGGIVMCQFKDDPPEYATWVFYNNDLRSTSHGHYGTDEVEVFKDFQKRVKREIYTS